jgi:hypothetical protein
MLSAKHGGADVVTIQQIAEAEREAAHMLPEAPHPHNAGLAALAYAGIALLVNAGLVSSGVPYLLAGVAAIVAAYAAGRYDSNRQWNRYYDLKHRIMAEKDKDDA